MRKRNFNNHENEIYLIVSVIFYNYTSLLVHSVEHQISNDNFWRKPISIGMLECRNV